MRNLLYILTVLLLLIPGCKGGKDIPLSGTVTIDNTIYGTTNFYGLGFNFTVAKTVSTIGNPEPDITVEEGIIYGGTVEKAFFSANTLTPPFALYGTYSTESEAIAAFEALTSFGTMTWINFGSPLEVNQIWIVLTREGNYAKVRVKEVVLDTEENYASCTFEWAFQPDGTKTFPSK